MNTNIFRNREEAARLLADELRSAELRDPLVLGIPRGGAETAAVLARELDAEVDVVLVRKLRAPSQPELAIGAISEDGEVFLGEHAEQIPGVTEEYIEQERRRRLDELHERGRKFREVKPQANVQGRSVILTDDGIATGSTMLAALQVVRSRQPHELIVAVPVGPRERLELIHERCDRLVCLEAPEGFMAIGQFYEQFQQVDDDRVCDLLREAARSHE